MGVRRNLEDVVDKVILFQARVIVVALILGQLILAGVIVYLHQSGSGQYDAELPELLRQIVAGLAILFVPVAFLLRRKAWGTSFTRSTAHSKGAFLKGYVLFHAILEGGSLLNLVFWMITSEPVPNALAAAILVAIQVLSFPRADRLPQANR